MTNKSSEIRHAVYSRLITVEGSDSAPDGYIRDSTRMQHKDSKIKKMWKRREETFEDTD